ncbi:MAG: transporter [Sphingosinicella sp.]|nr:transporter [Sphingosinicella sp.]
MSKRLAILTPDPDDEAYQSRWREIFEASAASLREIGLSAEHRSWAKPGDLGGFDLVMPLLAWGYFRAGSRWQQAVGEWETAGVPLANPASVLRWNADKLYLGKLAERGAPVVPTLYAERCTLEAMTQAVERFGTDRLIAKPQVSASAWRTIRWSPGEKLDGAPTGATMIQPYMPSIEKNGEISMLFFGGTFSHAISKVPQPGDFRVQPEYDGIITAHDPSKEEFEAATAILKAADEDLLYARVDLVRDLDGKPALMELELVEPDLYLAFDGQAPARFAQACAAIS